MEDQPICIDGILFTTDMQCHIGAPNKRIKVHVEPQLVLLPDSLVCISGKYPTFLWIEKNFDWKGLIGQSIRIHGTVQEFFSGEFWVHVERIEPCSPSPKPTQSTDLTDEEIDGLEEQIPLMANTILKQEGIRALLKGFDVVQSHDNALWITHPNGSETFIKTLPPRVPVDKDRVFLLDTFKD